MADPRLVGQQASVPGVFAYLLARHGGSVALLTCLPNEVCYVHPHEVAGASFFATNSWRHFGSLLWVCPPQISTQHFCTIVKFRVVPYTKPTPHMVVYTVCQTCMRHRQMSVAASFQLACFFGQTMPIERVCEHHYDLKRSDMAHHFKKLVKMARKWRRLTTKPKQACSQSSVECRALQTTQYVVDVNEFDINKVDVIGQDTGVGFIEFFDATLCILDASQASQASQHNALQASESLYVSNQNEQEQEEQQKEQQEKQQEEQQQKEQQQQQEEEEEEEQQESQGSAVPQTHDDLQASSTRNDGVQVQEPCTQDLQPSTQATKVVVPTPCRRDTKDVASDSWASKVNKVHKPAHRVSSNVTDKSLTAQTPMQRQTKQRSKYPPKVATPFGTFVCTHTTSTKAFSKVGTPKVVTKVDTSKVDPKVDPKTTHNTLQASSKGAKQACSLSTKATQASLERPLNKKQDETARLAPNIDASNMTKSEKPNKYSKQEDSKQDDSKQEDSKQEVFVQEDFKQEVFVQEDSKQEVFVQEDSNQEVFVQEESKQKDSVQTKKDVKKQEKKVVGKKKNTKKNKKKSNKKSTKSKAWKNDYSTDDECNIEAALNQNGIMEVDISFTVRKSLDVGVDFGAQSLPSLGRLVRNEDDPLSMKDLMRREDAFSDSSVPFGCKFSFRWDHIQRVVLLTTKICIALYLDNNHYDFAMRSLAASFAFPPSAARRIDAATLDMVQNSITNFKLLTSRSKTNCFWQFYEVYTPLGNLTLSLPVREFGVFDGPDIDARLVKQIALRILDSVLAFDDLCTTCDQVSILPDLVKASKSAPTFLDCTAARFGMRNHWWGASLSLAILAAQQRVANLLAWSRPFKLGPTVLSSMLLATRGKLFGRQALEAYSNVVRLEINAGLFAYTDTILRLEAEGKTLTGLCRQAVEWVLSGRVKRSVFARITNSRGTELAALRDKSFQAVLDDTPNFLDFCRPCGQHDLGDYLLTNNATNPPHPTNNVSSFANTKSSDEPSDQPSFTESSEQPSSTKSSDQLDDQPSFTESSEQPSEQPSSTKSSAQLDDQPSFTKSSDQLDDQPSEQPSFAESSEQPSSTKSSAQLDDQPSFTKSSDQLDDQPSEQPSFAESSEQPSSTKSIDQLDEQPSSIKSIDQLDDQARASTLKVGLFGKESVEASRTEICEIASPSGGYQFGKLVGRNNNAVNFVWSGAASDQAKTNFHAFADIYDAFMLRAHDTKTSRPFVVKAWAGSTILARFHYLTWLERTSNAGYYDLLVGMIGFVVELLFTGVKYPTGVMSEEPSPFWRAVLGVIAGCAVKHTLNYESIVAADENQEEKCDSDQPKTLKQQFVKYIPKTRQTHIPFKKPTREFVAGVTFATAVRACIFDSNM